MKTLRSHGRYPYWPITQAPPFRWPQGDGLAVYVALNLEHYAFGEGMLDELVPLGPAAGRAELSPGWNGATGSARGGFWSCSSRSTCRSRCWSTLPSTRARRGWWKHSARRDARSPRHGRTNAERQGDLPAEGEAALIAEATGEIARQEGAPPAGWLGPWISESEQTPDLLKEAGYRYVLDWCCDDRPIPLATRAGPLLAVPYPQEANDANAIVVRRMGADAFADLVVDQFDEMLQQAQGSAQGSALVCPVSLHPHVTRAGPPHPPSAPRAHAYRRAQGEDLDDPRVRHRRRGGARLWDRLNRRAVPPAAYMPDTACSVIKKQAAPVNNRSAACASCPCARRAARQLPFSRPSRLARSVPQLTLSAITRPSRSAPCRPMQRQSPHSSAPSPWAPRSSRVRPAWPARSRPPPCGSRAISRPA